MKIWEEYLNGLKEAYIKYNRKDEINKFEEIIEGASKKDITHLINKYNDVPESLIEILKYVDGTYYREFKKGELCFNFFASDVEEGRYPYYLLSTEEIINGMDDLDIYEEYVDREFDEEDVHMDEKIIDDSSKMNWLHFADCINNGGTSQLFIDFSPSKKGKKGQIIRYLHDPDEMEVIADSFDEYLQQIIDNDYVFVEQEDE